MEYLHWLLLWQPPDGPTRSMKWKPQTLWVSRMLFSIFWQNFPLMCTCTAPGPTGLEGTSTDAHTPGRCRFPKQGLALVSWRVYRYSSWVPYTLKVFRGRQTPCFYLNRSSSNADFFEQAPESSPAQTPSLGLGGSRASGSRGVQRRQTALEPSYSR